MWAVLFPGQGSQTIGMGQFYYNNFLIARQLFEEASDTLHVDFKKLCFEGPESTLMLTQNTQPAIVLVSYVASMCLAETTDLSFIKYTAGHSVGEYSALVFANVLSFTQALKAVQKRGLYMSQCCPSQQGGMSALLGPSSKEAQDFCDWVQKNSNYTPLEVANFNSPQQTILSGSMLALNWAKNYYQDYNFTAKKIRLIPLKVSNAFHSSMMSSACSKMSTFLNTLTFKKSSKTIVQNTTAQPPSNINTLKQNLVTQIKKPVLWQDSMQYLFQQNCRYFLELGEGKVLAGLIKQIDNSKKKFHFNSFEDIQTIKQIKNHIGK